MIQLERQRDLASRLGLPSEIFRSERKRQSEGNRGVEAAAPPCAEPGSEDEVMFVSPPPMPFPRVLPGL
jgi:hypothetical protein